MSDSFADRLADAVRQKRSALCVGLDPRTAQLPPEMGVTTGSGLAEQAAAYATFCKGIVDAVADRVAVVKPQAAFFEQMGPAGMTVLADVIRYASEAGLLVLLDGKRNDIGSTAEAYAAAYLGAGSLSPWGADALTISPYLGEDSIAPFVDVCVARSAGVFVLVKTSNAGGGLLQDRVTDGESVAMRVARLVESLNRSQRGDAGYGPVGAVVGATYPQQLAELRAAMPSAWILIPGFGAQGGGAADTAAGFDDDGLGAIVNSSRHILFAYNRADLKDRFSPDQWRDAARFATDEANEALRGATAMARLKA